MSFLKEVDAVFTWVDGSDVEWRKERSKMLKQSGINESDRRAPCLCSNDHKDCELYFGVLSLLRYAPWLRKIWIVTWDGQVPSWISEVPKVSVVHHTAIIPSTYLPTFSSRTIESFIHNIPGLSEAFLYLNDDMMVMNYIELEDFFLDRGDGKLLPWVRIQGKHGWTPADSGFREIAPNHLPRKGLSAYLASVRRVNAVLDQTYDQDEKRAKLMHQVYPLTKRLCQKTEETFHFEYESMRRRPFRSGNTITPLPLILFSGLYEIEAALMDPRDDRLKELWFSVPMKPHRSLSASLESLKGIHLVCINDMCESTHPVVKRQVIKFLKDNIVV